MNTEAQRVAIDLLLSQIRLAAAALFDKKIELESKEKTNEVISSLEIAALRLDLLAKIDVYLLSPIKEHYAFIERGADIIQPSDLRLMRESVETTFLMEVLQGLK